MTLDEAVSIMKEYANTDDLLMAMECMQTELSEAEDYHIWASPREIAAYRFICRKMRPLFFGE